MSNVIAFLESLGREPAQSMAKDGYAAAIAALEVDDATRSALLAADAGALGDLLGGRPKMVCMLFPADDDQKQEGDEPAEDEPAREEPEDTARH